MREGGASVERALQDARTSSERQLVQDVWRRRGSASQVQAEVEADCLADLERRERYGAPSQSMSVGGSSPGAERSPAGDPQAAERARQAQAARAAEQRQATCARLNARMDNLRTRERSGGNAATMDRLNEERRRLQNEIGNAGC